MDMAQTVINQLNQYEIPYQTVHHPYSISSLNSAHTAHIPANQLVKSVILKDSSGYLMALLPSDKYIFISELRSILGRNIELASEAEVSTLFQDCDLGAVPPVGNAYGMEMIVDFGLDNCSDVYIEAGNHEDLLHLSGESFNRLTANAKHADIIVH